MGLACFVIFPSMIYLNWGGIWCRVSGTCLKEYFSFFISLHQRNTKYDVKYNKTNTWLQIPNTTWLSIAQSGYRLHIPWQKNFTYDTFYKLSAAPTAMTVLKIDPRQTDDKKRPIFCQVRTRNQNFGFWNPIIEFRFLQYRALSPTCKMPELKLPVNRSFRYYSGIYFFGSSGKSVGKFRFGKFPHRQK